MRSWHQMWSRCVAPLGVIVALSGCAEGPLDGVEEAAGLDTVEQGLGWKLDIFKPADEPKLIKPLVEEEVRTETFETPFGPFELTYTVDAEGNAWLEDDIELDLEWLREEVEASWDEHAEMEAAGEIGDGFGQSVQGLAARREGRYFWPRATVYYTVAGDLLDNGAEPARIRDAIRHWEDNTPLRFVRRSAERDYVAFVSHGSRCSSEIGRQGGRQEIKLASGCRTGTVIHEIGHSVGLFHEQAREDRDDFVEILWGNIQSWKGHNFNKYSDNIFLFWGSRDGQDVGPYDFGSIMHYGSFFFSKNGDPTILRRHDCPGGDCTITANRAALSTNDKRYIHELYCPLVGWDANRCRNYLTPDPGFAWNIKPSAEADLCLDVRGGSMASHAGVQSFACHGGDNQLWTITPSADGYVYIRSKKSGLCLDVPNASDGPAEMQQYTCHRGDNQKWFLERQLGQVYVPDRHARFFVRNARHREMCLSIDDQGRLVQTWCGSNSPSIRHRWFQFVAKETAFSHYEVVNARSNECLDVPGLAMGDAGLQDYPCNGGDNQTWRFVPRPNDTFALEAKHSGRCMEVTSNAYSAPIGQRACDAQNDAQWFSPHLTPQGRVRLWRYWPNKCVQRVRSGALEAGVCDWSPMSGWGTPDPSAHWEINPRQ